MKRTSIKSVVLLGALLFFHKISSAQQFNSDGSMVLTAVSTDVKYGYQANHKHAIKVGKIENGKAFLDALRGPNGERVQYRRLGSCCAFKSKRAAFGKGYLDRYELSYPGLDRPVIIYVNGYEFEQPRCPSGFTFVKTK